jgi:hypothetical protein
MEKEINLEILLEVQVFSPPESEKVVSGMLSV